MKLKTLIPVSQKQVTFFQNVGGSIDFLYDKSAFYAEIESGTTIPLVAEEILYAPIKKCSCGNCHSRERFFSEDEVAHCAIEPSFVESETQHYFGNYDCWINVRLYLRADVDKNTPNGYAPCIAVLENETYRVCRFLDQLQDFYISPEISIKWRDIEKRFKFVTVDKSGVIEAWEVLPVVNCLHGHWQGGGYNEILQGGGDFTNFQNWEQLIFERPE